MAWAFRQLFPRPQWFTQGLPPPFTKWLLEAWNKIGQVQEWVDVGWSSGEPAFENSWANAGGAYETAAFYKDPYGRVHLKGRIGTGTAATTAFTLPAGYRPAGTIQCGSIVITAAGLVQPGATPDHLDDVSFRAEQ
jgi:hypothetical protein